MTNRLWLTAWALAVFGAIAESWQAKLAVVASIGVVVYGHLREDE
jgi:hypothetical protein